MTVPHVTQAACSRAVKTVTAATSYKGLRQEHTQTASEQYGGNETKGYQKEENVKKKKKMNIWHNNTNPKGIND